ncbi:hypothetical protein JCM10908_005621 [Rhodotorula pacifica]|uniref:uncharacterized protein n=1 Tax=Rhodotorula pacifica TaxID=1495444 RepID=UPI003177CD2A
MARSTRSDSTDSHDNGYTPNLAALAQLEKLLEAQLAPTSPALHTAPEQVGPPSKKRKKTVNDDTREEERSDEVAKPEQATEVAFRLFSSQKAPQRVILRAESTPPPIVLDSRIRDVQDEDPTKVEARRRKIESIAVDGQTILKQAKTLPSPHPPSYRLSHRTLTPSSYRATKTIPHHQQPTLAYLDACLPRPLFALSPYPVPAPEGTEPPRHPHEGLLVLPPFEEVYARRWRGTGAGASSKTNKAMKEAAAKNEETEKKQRLRLPRLPKRNRAYELGEGTGHGPLRLSAVYPIAGDKAVRREAGPVRKLAAAAEKKAGGAAGGGQGVRLSKARRMREKRRQAAGAMSTA